MHNTPTVAWNTKLRLAISDVDETISEVYTPAEPAMINELSSFLEDGGKLFMVSGGWLKHIRSNIIDSIEPSLRKGILVAHCSGSEVWGFTDTGELRDEPFYSVYEETFTSEMKQAWRTAVAQLIQEFGFRTHDVRPKLEFRKTLGDDPHDIMFEDRGSQITLQLTNAYDLSDEQLAKLANDVPYINDQRDLRMPVMERAEELFQAAGLPITPRLGGSTAIDMAVRGVSKTTAIKYVLERPDVLATIGLTTGDIQDPASLEIWGDKFSVLRGGTDRHMSEALPPAVRSIDFREENPAEFLEGYNIVVWDGRQHLHHGLLEYLQTRHKN
jgi:hydroxymethylpyrimidine pyrophosphatase-like HAD family hydrolase